MEHARGFALTWEDVRGGAPERYLDLGSGGGLPGLVLADRWRTPTTLLDSMERRGAFLREVLAWDGSPPDVDVVVERAEGAARDVRYDASFHLVTARSFGPPAVTAECAVRFVRVGGLIIVSDPPGGGGEDRWPPEPLRELGLVASPVSYGGYSFRVLEKVEATDERFPRPSGLPSRRPLF